MNRRLGLSILALALAAAGCRAAGANGAHDEKARAVFPHSPHGGFACTDCHDAVTKETRLGEAPLPGPAKCKECHEDGRRPPGNKPPEARLTFSHADHMPKVKNECTKCHLVLSDPEVHGSTVPTMSTCTSCHYHAQEFAEAKCQPCHQDLRAYPLKPIAAFSHEGDFLRRHGPLARTSAQTCAQCHDQTHCTNCHGPTTRPFKAEVQFPERVEAEFIHRGDYVSRHNIEAAAEPASCRRCHGSRFCDSCHQEQQISPLSRSPQDPHPKNWAFRGGPAFHGDAARENIVTCAGCHDQGAGAICVQCHRASPPGVGGNPHPIGWAKRHPNASERTSNPMCAVCHVASLR